MAKSKFCRRRFLFPVFLAPLLILGLIYYGEHHLDSGDRVVKDDGVITIVDTTTISPISTTPNTGIPQTLHECSGDNAACICPGSSLVKGNHRMVVIVPFRDGCAAGSQGGGRLKNLAEFVPALNAFLRKQSTDFRIIVVDQINKGLFNKGFLFNAGYLIANSTQSFDYVSLHDVDLVPENDANKYSFPLGVPAHLCVTNSRTDYTPAYEGMVGGVLLMRMEQYSAINGFANTYWTWGQEDDDMYNRIRGIFGSVTRPSPAVGRYRALDHDRVMGLDEKPRFKTQRKELYDAIAAANGGAGPTTLHVMKNGFRQINYKIVRAGCREDYDHYVVDYLNADQPMDPC